uniref:Uncharacterized protein n=1 Tax=viral metagenome TaxID=1070528 RepID=A0A6M3LRB6_9ZZZZ
MSLMEEFEAIYPDPCPKCNWKAEPGQCAWCAYHNRHAHQLEGAKMLLELLKTSPTYCGRFR